MGGGSNLQVGDKIIGIAGNSVDLPRTDKQAESLTRDVELTIKRGTRTDKDTIRELGENMRAILQKIKEYGPSKTKLQKKRTTVKPSVFSKIQKKQDKLKPSIAVKMTKTSSQDDNDGKLQAPPVSILDGISATVVES